MTIKNDINKLISEVQATGVTLPKVVIEKNALQLIPTYLSSKGFKSIVLVVDENTFQAAGSKLKKMLENEEIHVILVELLPNKHDQVIADEQTVMQLFAGIQSNVDVILAVGSGTIHDTVRFVGHKMNIPFISVPTAASVDGYTSKGAPLIFRGVKQTIQTASPVAVFADIDVIKAAPKEMTAAGFGDIVGKYTSLLDWNISSLIADEPYNVLAAELTKRSLEACVNNAQEIADRSDHGLKILMESLIESGLVMLVLDFSRPASGSEHHLSHYWEMDLLERNAKQLLHGEKVGVAATIIIDLYKQYVSSEEASNISSDSIYAKKLNENWDQIKTIINELPSSDFVRNLLQTVGGATTSEELNISNELVTLSLNEAFHLRDRCTGLFLINQFKAADIKNPIDYE